MKIPLKNYKENLLQWVWEELQFECNTLKTECGKGILIVDQGKKNNGAGPDFLHSSLIIDGVEWHGSVEIHRSAEEWYSHKHHEDRNFNNVVLHVVYENDKPVGVQTVDGHKPFTLNLRKYMVNSMHELMKIKQLSGLACSTSATFINQQAFERQIRKVHQEYFEYKIDEVLSYYPEEKVLSDAWKQALITHCYTTLGVSANSHPMEKLSQELFKTEYWPKDKKAFMDWVNSVAFEESTNYTFSWVTTGIRPAAHPENRVQQAAAIHYMIFNTPLSEFLKGPKNFFKILKNKLNKKEFPGKMVSELLFHLSVVPSHYMLGQLVHSKKLKKESLYIWQEEKQLLPPSIRKKYEKVGFNVEKEGNKLGLAHQYKRYCSLGRCKSCEVFKNSIGA